MRMTVASAVLHGRHCDIYILGFTKANNTPARRLVILDLYPLLELIVKPLWRSYCQSSRTP